MKNKTVLFITIFFVVFICILTCLASGIVYLLINKDSLKDASGDNSEQESSFQLKYNIQKGEKYDYKITTKQTIEQTYLGTTQKFIQEFGAGYYMEGINVSEDKFTVKYTYNWIMYKTTSNGTTISYDSDESSGNNPDLEAVYTPLLNKGFTVIFNSQGEILEVNGFDEMIESVIDSVSDSSVKTYLEDTLKSQYNEESIKSNLSQSSVIYPDYLISIGESWTKKMTIKAGYTAEMETEWKVIRKENNIVKIDVKSTIDTDENIPVTSQGYTFYYDLTGTQEGNMDVDLSSGLPITASVIQDMSGTMLYQSETVDMTMNSEIKITSTKVD